MLFAPEFPTSPRRRRPVRSALTGSAALITAAVGIGVGVAAVAGAETVWDKVAMCESSGNWSINTGNGYYGGLQFSYATWKGFGGQAYAETADKATKTQQITIAQKVLQVQGPGAWPTCGARAGLTLENGMADVTGTSTATVTQTASAPATPVTVTSSTFTTTSFTKPLTVDGVYGRLSKGATEKWVGGSVDGSLSVADAKALQRKVGAYPDGVIGPKTTKALQAKVGATPDGVWGSRTTKALQAYLNKVLYGL